MFASEARIAACQPINVRLQTATGLSRGSEYVPESRKPVWQIQTGADLSDQLAAVISGVGVPPVTYPPAICVRISIIDCITLMGVTRSIVTE
jgi:hypothetical protein